MPCRLYVIVKAKFEGQDQVKASQDQVVVVVDEYKLGFFANSC